MRGPLADRNVDVEARATSARKECARRPVLSDRRWAMALIEREDRSYLTIEAERLRPAWYRW